VKVVPGEGYSERDRDTVVAKLQERIGTSMQIRVETVPQIPRGGGGKFRYVVSRVKPKLLAGPAAEGPAATARR